LGSAVTILEHISGTLRYGRAYRLVITTDYGIRKHTSHIQPMKNRL